MLILNVSKKEFEIVLGSFIRNINKGQFPENSEKMFHCDLVCGTNNERVIIIKKYLLEIEEFAKVNKKLRRKNFWKTFLVLDPWEDISPRQQSWIDAAFRVEEEKSITLSKIKIGMSGYKVVQDKTTRMLRTNRH